MALMPNFRTKFWGLGLSWAWIPLLGFLVASAMILSLLIIWLAQGHPRYKSDEATIVYISDVGAANHALFIVLGSIAAVLYFWSLWMDYRLRHSQRIASRLRRFESWMSSIAILAGFVSAVCLILLTIFDAFNHSSIHWPCAIVFFIALVVSGIFNMAEIGGLYKDYPEDRLMRASFIMKLIIVVLAVVFIVLFAIMQGRCSAQTPNNSDGSDYIYCNGVASAAAVFEWLLGAIFCFYVLSFVLDLYPAKYTSRHHIPMTAKSAAKAQKYQGAHTEMNRVAPAQVPPGGAFTHGSASPGYPSQVSAADAGDVIDPMAPNNGRAQNGYGDGTTMV